MRGFLAWTDPLRKGFWDFKFSVNDFLAIGCGGLLFFILADSLLRVLWLVSSCNTFPHEFGHGAFGLLGIEFLSWAGGTLGQLLLPGVMFFGFLKSSQPFMSDLMLFWFGENFLDIGRYMADARARQLPLVTGILMIPVELVGGTNASQNDWSYLLGKFGLLQRDILISRGVVLAGCCVMSLAVFSLLRHLRDTWPSRPQRQSP